MTNYQKDRKKSRRILLESNDYVMIDGIREIQNQLEQNYWININ